MEARNTSDFPEIILKNETNSIYEISVQLAYKGEGSQVLKYPFCVYLTSHQGKEVILQLDQEAALYRL